ncbi:protein FAR-RED IMPAIRED RESPONSE 1-like [Arachis duranensis]|uniref:Protein FAR-RED IMPAIRED RESPONSE 1-like n=1 Tax=Arachis duranensis TaxID=130453 RepID=A0A9C6TV52_ARADU|nr:protein FAR-RED IMPAIRED RESPONSE 1-like [Arachis duranensis]
MAMARYSYTPEDRLGNLFWVDGLSRADYQLFEDESGSTYTWLLKNFLDIMLGKSPTVVVTDGDEGMKEEFKKCMYGKWHPDEFELRWPKMVDTFGLQNNDWVNIQYAKKKNWASSYLMDKFCAGFRTISQCEGINNYVKIFINSRHCLLNLVTNLERVVRDYRNNEMVAQFKTIYGEAVLTTGLTNLEHSAAEAYMKEIYGLVKKAIQAVVALELIKDRSISTTMIYKVYHNENRDRLYTVMYDRNDKNIECECKRWNSEGIPCRHMFYVMK